VSANTIQNHLRHSLGLKPCHFCWVSHELTYHLKEKTFVMCRELLELLQMEETLVLLGCNWGGVKDVSQLLSGSDVVGVRR
jgi:hypothetical protein